MGKKNRKEPQKKSGIVAKLRPFLLPLLFLLGSTGAYFINTNELMSKVKDASNVSPSNVFWIQILVYAGIVGFIFLGYKFQSLLDKREAELNKGKK
jgi:hypothetical protein